MSEVTLSAYKGTNIEKSFKEYNDLEKAGKDKSKLVPKKIVDKTGKHTTVWVTPEQAASSMKHAQQMHGADWSKDHANTYHQTLQGHHEQNESATKAKEEKGQEKQGKVAEVKTDPKSDDKPMMTEEIDASSSDKTKKLFDQGWHQAESIYDLIDNIKEDLKQYKVKIDVEAPESISGEGGEKTKIKVGNTTAWKTSEADDEDAVLENIHQAISQATDGKVGINLASNQDIGYWIKVQETSNQNAGKNKETKKSMNHFGLDAYEGNEAIMKAFK